MTLSVLLFISSSFSRLSCRVFTLPALLSLSCKGTNAAATKTAPAAFAAAAVPAGNPGSQVKDSLETKTKQKRNELIRRSSRKQDTKQDLRATLLPSCFADTKWLGSAVKAHGLHSLEGFKRSGQMHTPSRRIWQVILRPIADRF